MGMVLVEENFAGRWIEHVLEDAIWANNDGIKRHQRDLRDAEIKVAECRAAIAKLQTGVIEMQTHLDSLRSAAV